MFGWIYHILCLQFRNENCQGVTVRWSKLLMNLYTNIIRLVFELWYSKDWIYWMTWYCVLLTWYKKKEKSHMVNIKYDSIHGDLTWFIIDGDVMITKLPWNWMLYRLTTEIYTRNNDDIQQNKERETIMTMIWMYIFYIEQWKMEI